MEVDEAINLLKKYNLYEEAKQECKLKKLNQAPYNMKGCHEVYCHYLSDKMVELKKKCEKLVKIKCVEWNSIPENSKLVHDDCFFVIVSRKKSYCKTECKYYKENIETLEREISELLEAQKVLKEAAERDYYNS